MSRPVESFIFPPSDSGSFIFKYDPENLDKDCHSKHGIRYSFSNAQVPRLTHVLEPCQRKVLNQSMNLPLKKALKKRYTHTRIMIWSPKQDVIEKKNGYMTWASCKLGSISSNHSNLGALASFLRITSISRYHFMLLRFLAGWEANTEGHIEMLHLYPDIASWYCVKLTFWHMMHSWKRNHQNPSASFRISKTLEKAKGLVLLISQHYQPALAQPGNQTCRAQSAPRHPVWRARIHRESASFSSAGTQQRSASNEEGSGEICNYSKQDILLEEMKRLSLVLCFKYLKSHFHTGVFSVNDRMFPVGSLWFSLWASTQTIITPLRIWPAIPAAIVSVSVCTWTGTPCTTHHTSHWRGSTQSMPRGSSWADQMEKSSDQTRR